MKDLFQGRINRRNFILGILSSFGVIILWFLILILLGKNFDNPFINPVANLLWLAVLVGVLVFNLSVFVRRWHDLGRSGWFVLSNLIPYIGFLVIIFLLIAEGEHKTNKYGPVPNKNIKYPQDILNLK